VVDTDFWDGNIPAPLKPLAQLQANLAALHFWDGNIPAPLKRRWTWPTSRARMDFWDGNIPAPLKPFARNGGSGGNFRFLGWKHPGPIEAMERLVVTVAEPSISGMETSRPH